MLDEKIDVLCNIKSNTFVFYLYCLRAFERFLFLIFFCIWDESYTSSKSECPLNFLRFLYYI